VPDPFAPLLRTTKAAPSSMTTTARMPPTIFSNFLIVLFIAIYSCAAKLGIYFLSTKYSANFFANYLEVSEILHIFAP